MQESESDKDLNPTDRPSWWKRLLIGALGGAIYGAFNIWFYEFSLRRLAAAVITGAGFFVVLGLLGPHFRKDKLKAIAVSGFAGFVAGALYWVVAQTSSLPLAMGIGLVGAIVWAWAEWQD